MGDPTALSPHHRPTDGQLALAREVADGGRAPEQPVTRVPASVYTDPAHFAREKAALYDRMPQILCPTALLLDPGMAVPHDALGCGGAARHCRMWRCRTTP